MAPCLCLRVPTIDVPERFSYQSEDKDQGNSNPRQVGEHRGLESQVLVQQAANIGRGKADQPAKRGHPAHDLASLTFGDAVRQQGHERWRPCGGT